jgi:transglutaminase-like putative cysteine protease
MSHFLAQLLSKLTRKIAMYLHKKNRFGVVALLAIGVSMFGLRTASANEDFPIRVVSQDVRFTVQLDGSYEEVRTSTRRVVLRSGIEYLRRDSVTFSTSAQTGEIVEAYTLKPDGKRVEVRPDSYQIEINKGVQAGKPAYSDRTTLSVVFPGLEVGDSVVFTTRIKTHTPIFPGQFSEVEFHSKSRPYDEATASFDWPEKMPIRYAIKDCEERKVEAAAGRKGVAIRCTNTDYKTPKRRDWSVHDFDTETGILISSHPDYASIADAYWAGAKPKLVVNERIKTLAQKILTDANVASNSSDRRAVVRALYEWVSLNIGYAGNCVGVGTHVPRDLDWVLDNKLGDCKDHSLLLQALMQTQGISSKQALVNAGGGFRLARIPVVGLVNHVINYVPSMDLFLDSTATGTPFETVPLGIAGKPVLLTDGYVEGKTVPMPKVGFTWQKMKGSINVKADGSAAGDFTVNLGGSFAASIRASWREMTPEMEKRYINDVYDRDGSGKGWAKLVMKDDPKPMLPTYNYQIQFNYPDYIQPGAGAIGLRALVMSPGSPASLVSMSQMDVATPLIACMGARASEEITFTLPPGRQILSVPKDISIKTKHAQ